MKISQMLITSGILFTASPKKAKEISEAISAYNACKADNLFITVFLLPKIISTLLILPLYLKTKLLQSLFLRQDQLILLTISYQKNSVLYSKKWMPMPPV